MRQYKSKPSITLLLDVLAMAISFCIALLVRYNKLIEATGSRVVVPMYIKFFIGAPVLYVALFFMFERTRIERNLLSAELISLFYCQNDVLAVLQRELMRRNWTIYVEPSPLADDNLKYKNWLAAFRKRL